MALAAGRIARRPVISPSFIMGSSMSLEEGAGDQFVNQRAKASALLLRALHQPGDVVAVAELDLPADRVADELLGHVPQELRRVRREKCLELEDVFEGAAVGGGAGRVHRGPELEADADERIDRSAGRLVAGPDRAVTGALPADDVEGLEREARRIDLRVAGRAGLVRAVLLEQFPDRRGAA